MVHFTPMDFIQHEMVHVEMTPLNDFMMRYREKFEPELDIDFMEYFLELTKHENRNQFIIHHEKLFEYGITIDKESRRVKERIDGLKFQQDADYQLTKVRQQSETSRGIKTKNEYLFTPRAFKKILLAARPHARHAINVERYRDYYLFLEEVVGYYNEYQIMYKDHRNAILTSDNKSLSQKMDEQSAQIAKLLEFGEKASIDRQELKDELADVKMELGSSKKTIDKIADHLEQKSKSSTKDPTYTGFHHHALVTTKQSSFGMEYKFTSGQSDYVDKTLIELESRGYEIHKPKFYNANGIDYRRNVESEMLALIEERLAPVNAPIIEKRERLKREIEETNAMLLEDIPKWNADLAEKVRVHNLTAVQQVKISSDGRRYRYGRNKTFAYLRRYENECRSFERECLRAEYRLTETPIKVGSTFISWKPNKYVSLQDINDLIDRVIEQTQKSPYSSETGSDDGY